MERYNIGDKKCSEVYNLEETTSGSDKRSSSLPEDPRDWSRQDVCKWVKMLCSQHHLPPPDVARFLMNGKAVCLMSVQMFSTRVPLGGKLLYRDFQLRLANALYKEL